MSQEELSSVAAAAGAVGATRQSQALYEKGQRYPDVAYMSAVARVGVDVRYVVTGERDYAPPAALSAEEQGLLALYRLAEPAVRKAVLRALATGEVSVAGPKTIKHGATTVVVHGDIGQQVKGDIQAPQTFTVGGRVRKVKGA